MTNLVHKPLVSAPFKVLSAGTRATAARIGDAVLAAASGTSVFLRVVFDLNGELLRMADECEDRLPEHAARMRAVVRKGWDG